MAVTNSAGTGRSHGSAVGTGAFAAVVLVAVCGSPAYVDWAAANTDPAGAGGWFLRLLAWPAWRFGVGEGSGVSAADVTAILLVLLAAGFLHLLPAGRQARSPGVGQFFTGWAAYVLASGFAAFLGSFLGSDAALTAAFQATGTGVTYGFFAGWIIGAASLGGRA
ncbi:hypothetical protein [Micromonospora fluostatini]